MFIIFLLIVKEELLVICLVFLVLFLIMYNDVLKIILVFLLIFKLIVGFDILCFVVDVFK